MGYRVTYGQASDRRYPSPTQKSYFALLLPCAVLAFLLLTRLFWPEGHRALREMLIPGDPQVTAAAFSELVETIRSGESLPEALRVFCSEILYVQTHAA